MLHFTSVPDHGAFQTRIGDYILSIFKKAPTNQGELKKA